MCWHRGVRSLRSLTQARLRREDDMKTVEEEKATITKILEQGLNNGLISEDEYNAALSLSTWETLQPFLNKAQGVQAAPDSLKQAREETPLYRSDFTESELEKLKSLAPEEYEMLR